MASHDTRARDLAGATVLILVFALLGCSEAGSPLSSSAAAVDADSAQGSGSDGESALTDASGAASSDASSDGTTGADQTADTGQAGDSAQVVDTGLVGDTGTADLDVVVPKGEVGVAIAAPIDGTVIESGQPLDLVATASDTLFAEAELTATWISSKDGVLWQGPVGADGQVKVTGVVLSPGPHQLTFEAANPTGVSAQTSVSVGVCSWGSPQSFDTKLDGAKWQIFGDAYWDAGGWLEMTGNAQSKFGKIWNISDFIQPGDVQISFDFQTGGGINGGADGFAMSVFEAKSLTELQTILAATKDGGCLGYGVSGACGTMKVKAFHVEIDTFHNTGDPNQDPTYDNHIGVLLDGDASNHVLWKAATGIEDLQWHTLSVQVDGAKVTVKLDGNALISEVIPDFEFRGGYIGFSGSTGWASNWHRFDNLQILQQCLVQ